MNRVTLASILTVSALAIGSVVWLVAWSYQPPDAEAHLVASLDPTPAPGTKRSPRAHGQAAIGARRPNGEGRSERSAPEPGTADAAERVPRTVAEEVRARNLDDEERAAFRREIREERLVDVNARLDTFAAEEGWDPDQVDAIRDILIDTADHITRTLARVDRREIEWDDVKGDLRSYRETQAQSVRRAVGEANFDRFVERMDFARFFGDAPVRGRLE